jgi:tRNA-splicing ligase RtcB
MDFEKLGQSHFKIKDEKVEVFAKKSLLDMMGKDRTFLQAVEVSKLPGLIGNVKLMPDAHEGFGFPIGGVAAFEDIVTPGGVGFDINCGVRVLVSDLTFSEIEKELNQLSVALFEKIPSGLGRGGNIRCDVEKVLESGLDWCIEEGYATSGDKERIEESGVMEGIPDFVSEKAKKRGKDQLGTLGSGNHFIEVQKVEKSFKKIWGLEEDRVVVMIHTGSRGLGHQVCSDYVKILQKNLPKDLPSKELAYTKIDSEIGRRYLGAMRGAVNYAFSNRQVLTHLTRGVFEKLFSSKLELLYDVAHNIAKVEDGKVVHRKGATRAFGPGDDIGKPYQKTGQPVLIPGSMGTSSYILVGRNLSKEKTLGSVCHGAGRVLSRSAAKRKFKDVNVRLRLFERGIIARSQSRKGLLEEIPEAYKDVDEVVGSVVENGLSEKVSRLTPLCVIKG